MTLHIQPQPVSLPNINFLHLTVSEILLGKVFKMKVTMARPKVKSRSHHEVADLQPPISLPTINFLHLMVSKIQPEQDFQTQGHYGKVKLRSHEDVAHLYPLTNVPTKYQLPTPYGF